MKLLKKYIHLILLLFILILAFRIRYIDSIYLADLKPWPDSFEYSLGAYNLKHHHIYGIKYAGQYYPAMYPYGYPLLIIPFYIIFGSQPYNAVYCSLFFSLLTIVFAYMVGRKLGNRWTGLAAALFVTFLPSHIYFSKLIMSESLSVFLVLLICWLLLKVKELDSRKQRLLLLVLGLVTGFSVSVHITNCLLIPPVLIALLLRRKSNPSSLYKEEGIVLFGIILALIPLFLYQSHTYGSPLRTGYEVWFPEYFEEKSEVFSFDFFAKPHGPYKRGNFMAFVFALIGLEKPVYPASMVPLFLVAFLFILSKRRAHNKQLIFLTFSSIFVFLLFTFFSFYAWQGGDHHRYLLRAFPLLMVLAAYGATFLIDKGIFKSLAKESIFSLTMLCLLLVTIIQMGMWSYSEPKLPHRIDNRQYKIIRDISVHIRNNAVIISQLDPEISEYYFAEHTADKIVYIVLSSTKFRRKMAMGYIKPIRYDRSKKYSFLFRLNGALNPRTYNFIRRSLKKDAPVYFVDLPDNPLSKMTRPFIERYFSLIEQEGDSRLFRLYPKDW